VPSFGSDDCLTKERRCLCGFHAFIVKRFRVFRAPLQWFRRDRPKGAYSRQTVRERVEKWDRLPKHPNISHYGDPDHREWKQYFIGDDVEPLKGKCPFLHKIEK
ncbi:YqcI/YcgG family protein, partial [Bacillus cereus]